MLTRLGSEVCLVDRAFLSLCNLRFCMCVQCRFMCLNTYYNSITYIMLLQRVFCLISAVHSYARPVRRVPLHGRRLSQWCSGEFMLLSECHVTVSQKKTLILLTYLISAGAWEPDRFQNMIWVQESWDKSGIVRISMV